MRSPAELKVVLRRQWDDTPRREARLLGAANAWPIAVSIGRPSPRRLTADLDSVKRHVEAWRKVCIGEVVWESVRYRAATSQVQVPTLWKLYKPSDWIAACADDVMRREFAALAALVEHTDATFHSLLIRRRSLWRDKSVGDVVQAVKLALALEPGCAAGNPLRLISYEGIDTKFFERNARLMTALLDARFDGEASQVGLETFLGALMEGDRWLLVVDLDGALLPFRRLRVRSSDLRETALPGDKLLIVENESCQHLLPDVPGAVAVLGAGFDLDWTGANWLQVKRVAYWGDIDTWGLQFLSRARQSIANLTPLLMTAATFDDHPTSHIREPLPAAASPPPHLTAEEQSLYTRLLHEPLGRLEQEFISQQIVHATLHSWSES